jgi:hypothetical protein
MKLEMTAMTDKEEVSKRRGSISLCTPVGTVAAGTTIAKDFGGDEDEGLSIVS